MGEGQEETGEEALEEETKGDYTCRRFMYTNNFL